MPHHHLGNLSSCRPAAGVLLAAGICLLAIASAPAASTRFFKAEEPVEFRLEAPLTSLKKQRDENPEWLDGKVYVKSGDGTELVVEVQIQARGNFRRLESSCSFPSYWINFKKKQLDGTALDGLDKVKVVSHCRETRKSFEPYIFKEYLAYKTYNLITEQSFRVRLANIAYVNTEKKSKTPTVHAAFFIEHVDDFAARIGGQQITDRYVLPSLFSQKELCRAEMFQFFVGNTDFSFFASTEECCHNGKVFSMADGYLAVPYDFDLTGLVNVPYASVNPKLPIKSVTERYYRGLEMPDDVLQDIIRLYIGKKQEILTLWTNASFLPDADKAKALKYIEGFYAIIENPEKVRKEITARFLDEERMEATVHGLMQSAANKADP